MNDLLSYTKRIEEFYNQFRGKHLLIYMDDKYYILCRYEGNELYTGFTKANLSSYAYDRPTLVCMASDFSDYDWNFLMTQIKSFIKHCDQIRDESEIKAVFNNRNISEEVSVREQTLDEAKKCVMGDREQDYGTPKSNFATIAKLWTDYLDKDISAQQVADMMILMKISRIKNGGGTGDSYVDIAGYAACGNEILSKRV